MEYFEQGKVILKTKLGRHEWKFFVANIYNPSPDEIELHQKHNDTLGNYEPDKELPVGPFVTIFAESDNGENLKMWFDPKHGQLGPHISKEHWNRGLFGRLKGILCSWRLPAPT